MNIRIRWTYSHLKPPGPHGVTWFKLIVSYSVRVYAFFKHKKLQNACSLKCSVKEAFKAGNYVHLKKGWIMFFHRNFNQALDTCPMNLFVQVEYFLVVTVCDIRVLPAGLVVPHNAPRVAELQGVPVLRACLSVYQVNPFHALCGPPRDLWRCPPPAAHRTILPESSGWWQHPVPGTRRRRSLQCHVTDRPSWTDNSSWTWNKAIIIKLKIILIRMTMKQFYFSWVVLHIWEIFCKKC